MTASISTQIKKRTRFSSICGTSEKEVIPKYCLQCNMIIYCLCHYLQPKNQLCNAEKYDITIKFRTFSDI